MDSKHIRRSAALAAAIGAVGLLAFSASAQLRPAAQIVVSGQDTPDAGVKFSTFSTSGPIFVMNNEGEVYFYATLTGTGVVAPTTSTYGNNQGGYVSDGVTITKVVRRDDLANGFDPVPPVYYGNLGSAYSQFLGTASTSIDDLGNVTFRPWLNGVTISTPLNSAYYMGPASAPVLIAQSGTELPASALAGGLVAGQLYKGSTSASSSGLNFNSVLQNGRLVFLSDITNSDNSAAGSALFIGSSANVTTVAYGQTANGTLIGADRLTTLSTGAWRLNDDGVVLFSGTLNAVSADTALIKGTSSADLAIVARAGGATSYTDVTYKSFDFTDRAIAGNHIGFQATLQGTGVTTSNDSAMFLTLPNGTLKGVAREGDPVPSQPLVSDMPKDATHMQFATLDNMKLAKSGYLLFSAQLRADNATSGSSTYDALYLANFDGNGDPVVREIALEKDTKDFSQAAVHYERGAFDWHLERWNGISGTSTGLNASGQVVFYAGASAPDSSLTEVESYFLYDPALSRVFPLVGEGVDVLVDTDGPGGEDPVAKTVTSISTPDAGGGAGDGGKSIFNDVGQLVIRAAYSGGEGFFRLNTSDYVPTKFAVWMGAAGGDWAAGPWDTSEPNGEKHYAEFSSAITAPADITVSGTKTLGEVFFKNANKVTLTGGKLVMDGVFDQGFIGVAQGSHEIGSEIELKDTTSVITDIGTTLTLSGTISGEGDFRKGGPGEAILRGANTYTGNNALRAGYTNVAATENLGALSNSITLDGGVLRFAESFAEARNILITADSRTTNLECGIDVVADKTATLTGEMSFVAYSATDGGYLNKTGAGKLVMANTGGPGGIDVEAGIVEVTTPQVWGGALNKAAGTLIVTPTGSILTTAGFSASSGGLIQLDGPVTTTGTASANAGSTVVINSASTFGALSVSGTSTAGATGGRMEIRGDTTVSGKVNLSSGSASVAVLELYPGVTLTAAEVGSFGQIIIPETASLIQTDAAKKINLSTGTIFNSAGTVQAAGDIEIGTGSSTSDIVATFSGPTTIGGDLQVTAAVGSGTFSSALTTITGAVFIDTVTTDTHSVTFDGDEVEAGSVLFKLSTTSTKSSPESALTIAAGTTFRTGDFTLMSDRTSTSSPANLLTGLGTLNVAGTLEAGPLWINSREAAANTNDSTFTVSVSGTAAFTNIRHEARLNNVLQPKPNIITEDINISGLVQIKPNGADLGMSSLANVPDFIGSGKLDVTDNAIAFHTATMEAVQAALAGGYGGGAGIITSTADEIYGLAAFTGAALGVSTYRGQPINADSIVVIQVLQGDADLNNVIDGDDYYRVDQSYLGNLAGATYADGDYNFDRVVDGEDYAILDNSFLNQPAAPAGVQAVPEPSTLGPLAGAGLLLMARRRRQA